jgi:hypothetical protein
LRCRGSVRYLCSVMYLCSVFSPPPSEESPLKKSPSCTCSTNRSLDADGFCRVCLFAGRCCRRLDNTVRVRYRITPLIEQSTAGFVSGKSQ